LDRFLVKEYTEDIFYAFRENLSLVFSYYTKFSNFFGTKKNLEFHIIHHLFNILLRNDIENKTALQIANLLNRFCLSNSNFSTKKFNLLNVKECILLIKILFLPEDLDLNSIENFCNFLSFFISNSEFNFDYDKIFLFSSDLNNKNNNNNINFYRFYLIRKLCELSSINKISSILVSSLDNNNNDLDIMKFMPKENKPNWK
jgi:hypothetical protein